MCSSIRTGFTEENHPDLTSHIEGGEECSNTQQDINNREMLARIQKDFILRPKPSKRDDTGKCQRPDHIKPKCDRHGLAKSTHVTHVSGVKDLDCVLRTPLSASFTVVFFLLFLILSLELLIMMSMRQVVMSTLDSKEDRTS